MSPTRRDLFKRIGAAAVVAAIPAVAVASPAPTLASVFDLTNPTPAILASVNGFTLIHWAERWSLAERARFLDVIEREFPAIAADVIGHMEWLAANPRMSE